MIWVTGDCHGDFTRFSTKRFPQQKQMTREDLVIVCGDFGLWHDTPGERFWLSWLDNKPFTTLWVDGNHDNHGRLAQFPVERWHGGAVQRVRPNVLRLCRGQVFQLDGKKCFVLGGAQSHDAKILLSQEQNTAQTRRILKRHKTPFRVEGESWWSQELPSQAEYRQALDNLAWEDWSVDYVFTHCLPTDLQKRLFLDYPVNALTDFLERVQKRLTYRNWFCGHHHQNIPLSNENIHILYDQIIPIK